MPGEVPRLTGGLMVTVSIRGVEYQKKKKEMGLPRLHCGPLDDRIHEVGFTKIRQNEKNLQLIICDWDKSMTAILLSCDAYCMVELTIVSTIVSYHIQHCLFHSLCIAHH